MYTLSSLAGSLHLIGLIMAVGSATVKTVLLLKCYHNYEFVAIFNRVVKTINRLLMVGFLLLIISGTGWLLMGYSFTPTLILKMVLVGLVCLFGAGIDIVVAPKFERLSPVNAKEVSGDFIRVQKQFMALELTATGLFYALTLLGVLL